MFQARRTRHFARSARRGEEKRKRLLITSPLFWLFRPPTPSSVDWRRWCQKNQSKHDTVLENCHLSGYQKHRQQHNPQVIRTTRALITFNNLPLSAAKVRFALSKFSLCPSKHSGEKEKEGKPVENKFQGRASHYHEPHEAFLACQHLISKTQ